MLIYCDAGTGALSMLRNVAAEIIRPWPRAREQGSKRVMS